MVSTAIEDLDKFRLENGGGDARGSLLLGVGYCGNMNDGSTTDATVTAAVSTDATSAIETGSTEPLTPNDNDEATNSLDFDLLTMMGYCAPTDGIARLCQPSPAPPTIQIADEIYALRLDTIFVLGMRQNLTKNDIVVFFGKIGRIKMDELTMKPKIFVYKNKLTGRSKGQATITYTNAYAAQAAIQYLNGSKFLGHVLSVVPAYLSTRPGKSVRFCYAQETGIEQQRRQRQKKWKPAYDNWVCELCRNSNFVWRMTCNRCRVSKSDAGAMSTVGQTLWRPRKHDWNCCYCFNDNFWYRQKCNRCNAPKTDLHSISETDRVTWELAIRQTSVV
ncbi:GH19314 [Drosophila grimshawi]|uniref:GH19314 n=2 Tax=Drosophila grimshawi TaxID=7222 RepID=B4JFG5_DROGR|nr:GH19314 [Drosophila grimshawi]